MIVLTGGAGFIGSCMLSALNAAGRNDVLIVDALRTGEKWKNLVGHSFIDIVSKETFRERMMVGDVDTVDTVIHMGACSTTTERDADYLYDNNFRYSTEIAEFALEAGARFIYASSAATYGDGSRGYSDRETDLRPLNMYGYSKHLFDGWVREQGIENQVVGLKFFNVFGPNEYHKGPQASMIFKAVKQVGDEGVVKLFASNHPDYADGEQRRDFVYVKDAVDIILTLMQRPDVNGIFNLGTGIARSWNDVAKAVFAALGKETRIEYIPMPSSIAGQYQNYTQADMSTLASILPSVSFRSLEDSIADYVTGHLLSEWPYL
jgi:ADP-L-glycero-D-manno-heptose 6-epimerase